MCLSWARIKIQASHCLLAAVKSMHPATETNFTQPLHDRLMERDIILGKLLASDIIYTEKYQAIAVRSAIANIRDWALVFLLLSSAQLNHCIATT